MSATMLLAVLLTGGGPTGAPLCDRVNSRIAPDMRIMESDLEQPAAVARAEWLRERIAVGETGGESLFGVLNALAVIKGHALLRQARSHRRLFGPESVEARESTRVLCSWLEREGFWHD